MLVVSEEATEVPSVSAAAHGWLVQLDRTGRRKLEDRGLRSARQTSVTGDEAVVETLAEHVVVESLRAGPWVARKELERLGIGLSWGRNH